MKNDIVLFQELSHKAWAAKDNILYKGWILRLSEGVTRRANSVFTLNYLGDDLVRDIQNVESIYDSRNLPVVFQVSDKYEPENLIEVLTSSGYERSDDTMVMSKDLNDIPAISSIPNITISTELGVNEKWFQSLEKLYTSYDDNIVGLKNKINNGLKCTLDRSPFGKVTCYAKDKDEVVGTVVGIIEESYIGIYNLLVDKNRTREGIGENIMLKVMNWAKVNGIQTVYLSVEKKNTGAVALYQKIGFEMKYNYRYFQKNL